MLIRFTIAIIVAVVISGFFQGYINPDAGIYQINLATMLSFLTATVITALLIPLGSQIGEKEQDSATSNKPRTQKTKKSNNANDNADLPREEGVVKWFNVSKGFGFITRGNGEELFVHYRSIRDSGQNHGRRRLFENQVVTYAVVDSNKGLQADNVDVIQ